MSYTINPHYNGVTATPGVWDGGPGCRLNGPGVAPVEPEGPQILPGEGTSPEEALEAKIRGQADTATVTQTGS